jgi:hypothetical protein
LRERLCLAVQLADPLEQWLGGRRRLGPRAGEALLRQGPAASAEEIAHFLHARMKST